ncbi:hypothetical protein ACM26V_19585 [Salipaludibacillus sp. HK11]|uniref:hypothetical protein n=1 Tax=Salipaludibacillus sp. HK11 TaxID=3394320 RepID=UPI0039FC6A49
MKKTLDILLEMVRMIFVIFILLFGYSFVNIIFIVLLGGLEVIEETVYFNLFLILQTGAIFLLSTIFYRNKLQFSKIFKSETQEPLSKKRTKQLFLISIGAIIVSYFILITNLFLT